MEDYLISKIVRKILMPIVGILLGASFVYGWWIDDYNKAFRQVYIEPMQHVIGLIVQPRLNRLENRIDRLSTTTPM